MSSYYHFNGHQHPTPPSSSAMGHSHHGGRNRRAPRVSVSQNSHKQFRQPRTVREMAEGVNLAAFRSKFEAGRSFDLEDDLEFCPSLLSESDLVSIHSASSERSSLASNSPKLEHSPSQPAQVTPAAFALNSSSPPFVPPTFQSQQSSTLKLHQPSATRARNAIPIINPLTGITMTSPSPPSVSPGAPGTRMQQGISRRW
jgi:hypothetical protein